MVKSDVIWHHKGCRMQKLAQILLFFTVIYEVNVLIAKIAATYKMEHLSMMQNFVKVVNVSQFTN